MAFTSSFIDQLEKERTRLQQLRQDCQKTLTETMATLKEADGKLEALNKFSAEFGKDEVVNAPAKRRRESAGTITKEVVAFLKEKYPYSASSQDIRLNVEASGFKMSSETISRLCKQGVVVRTGKDPNSRLGYMYALKVTGVSLDKLAVPQDKARSNNG